MASAISRLPLRKYTHFFLDAKRIDFRCCSVFLKANSVKKTRLGVVVPKRVLDLAVRRNAMKRMVRGYLSPTLSTGAGWDIVIRVKNSYHTEEDMYAVRTKIGSLVDTKY